ncbi:Glycoside hydrolase [Pleurostoma richardsiae]|uniref:Glycoside hydrolase n=1 Tax=Pleurostoma richardsiae TaxID=41990 RepID=A0AA38RQW3_9PEZI|nr:Glycoside hydrolase [Pleurostoma richardsiae]
MHPVSLLAAAAPPLAAARAWPGFTLRQSANKLTVDLTTKYQTIDGFGFSEAFQRANNIVNLPEPKRSTLVDLLFNATTGAGFTILRNGIGSSPDSSNDWMNSIVPKGPSRPDGSLVFVWDNKDSGQLWVAQQAVRYGVKTFYADAWSAPGFMKTNGRDSNGGGLCGSPGSTCSSGDWRQAYVKYLVQYMQFYKDSGVNITHLGFLNEPDMSTSYASMQMNGNQAADFIKVLSATLQQSSNFSDVATACCDATGWTAQAAMTSAIHSAGAEPLVGVITAHTYSSGIAGTQPTTRKVWETECSDLSGRWSTAWYTNGAAGDGVTWAGNIHAGLTAGNVSAYLWWVATQDRATNGNNNEKLILVDDQDYEVSKRFWAFAQYSRTVRPGAVRVGISGGSGLKATAFVNADGSVAVNVINTGAAAVALSVAGVRASVARAWVTDDIHDMDAAPATVGSDGSVDGVSVPGRGMVSFMIEQASSVAGG